MNDAHSWTLDKQKEQNRRTFFCHFLQQQLTGANADQVTIDILHEDVLLDIFDFLAVRSDRFEAEDWWRTLVHVCRKWRIVVFGSPQRLYLRLVCSEGTPVREMLDVWPPLPIVIYHLAPPKSGWDNIIAALRLKALNGRVCQIGLALDMQWENVLEAMQETFPALTRLALVSDIEIAPVVPDSFMGGSAPRLQYLELKRVSIPGLTKLLLSATDLVHLNLQRIPHSGYISPEAIVACLSTLPKLRTLHLGFESLRSRPNRESRRLSRSVLPVLIRFHFSGVSEYLEDLLSRIDSPLLDVLDILLFHQPIFDTPQLTQFISRTPKLKVRDQAFVDFTDFSSRIVFPIISPSCHLIMLRIACRQPERQLSSMAQICKFFPLSLIHMVKRLHIREKSDAVREWRDDIDNDQWLDLLRPFTAVKKLHLSKEIGSRIARSLEELVGGRTTEVLPALQKLILKELPPSESGAFKEAIKKFAAARRLSNHPVAISRKRSK